MDSRTYITTILCSAVLLGPGLLAGCGTAPPPPQAVFNTLSGERIDLASLRGAPVVVNFWSVTCAPCLRDMPKLMALQRDMAASGVRVVGVSMEYDPPHLVVQRMQSFETQYPISLDLRGTIAASFGGVDATPTTFVLDADGTIVARYTGSLDFADLRATLKSLMRRA